MNEDNFEVNTFGDYKNEQYAYLRTLSPKSNAIYNFLVIALIVLIAALPFIHVQIGGHAYFVIQPKPPIETIYSATAGKIRKLNITDNKLVQLGDTLATIEQGPINVATNPAPGLSETFPKDRPVVANVSGVGNIVEGLQVGTYVQGGQKLAEILPDSSLTAVCYIAPNEIAYFKEGQEINLQLDAFNYNEWGMLGATVVEIKKNVAIVENRPFYVVHCKIARPYMALKNGYQGAIVKGMTGRANFQKSKRTLWQLLFTKVSEWFNPNTTK